MAYTPLDEKIIAEFTGNVVRKDLSAHIKSNAPVPTYVLEYLLGQYATSHDETQIAEGIERVKLIMQNNFVQRNQAELIKSTIREKGPKLLIDRIHVIFNDKDDRYEASFNNLGISEVIIDPATVRANPKLLTTGVWCLPRVSYNGTTEKGVSPWSIDSLKPVQHSGFNFEEFTKHRAEFTTEEWIDVLMQSIGLNPEFFGTRQKLFQLTRLIPFVERNYNLIELGPKGTGKTHVYTEFSPHGIVISGGDVTVPKLFINNTTGRIGLVGYWDVVAFDEFAGRTRRPQRELVDIMKNYMANKSFSRGSDVQSAEASFAFVGNTAHNVPHMLKYSDLFSELPANYHDPAFIDRFHTYIPGWEVETVRNEMFTQGFGFVVDYLAEGLRYMRNLDYSQHASTYFELDNSLSKRDRDGVNKTFSGLLKLIYPHEIFTSEQAEELFTFAIEGRKRVKDQLCRIDSTMTQPRFAYREKASGEERTVQTLEEVEYPHLYWRESSQNQEDQMLPSLDEAAGDHLQVDSAPSPEIPASTHPDGKSGPQEKRIEIRENQTGITYQALFAEYLRGATLIQLEDAYIRRYHQGRNLLDLLAVVHSVKAPESEIVFTLRSGSDEYGGFTQEQEDMFAEIKKQVQALGITFIYTHDPDAHDRSIKCNNGWIIDLGIGLDMFQKPARGSFSLEFNYQQFRKTKRLVLNYTFEAEGNTVPHA